MELVSRESGMWTSERYFDRLTNNNSVDHPSQHSRTRVEFFIPQWHSEDITLTTVWNYRFNYINYSSKLQIE